LATTRADADGRYEFRDVPLDSYRVVVAEADSSQDVMLTRDRPAAAANFDLSGVAVVLEANVVQGMVRGGAGRTVHLSRPADGWSQDQTVAPDGSYRLEKLASGSYAVAVAGTDVSQAGIVLNGKDEASVDLVVPGWGWQVTDGGASPGFGVVRCRVKGRTDQRVRLWTAGWEGMMQRTGSKPEHGSDACEFAPLGAGKYKAQPDGVDATAELAVDGSRVVWITFAEQATKPAPQGSIAGTVTGGGGRAIRLLRPPASELMAQAQATADGSYRFEKLAPGSYTVQALKGGPGTNVAVQKADVTVEGANPVEVNLTVPGQGPAGMRWSVEDGGVGPGFSVVRCRVAGLPGRAVSLWTWGWGGVTQLSGSKPEYGPDACEFAPLGPGVYFVELEEPASAGDPPQTVRAEVNLAANRVAWVRFERTEPSAVQPVQFSAPAQQPTPIAPLATAADSTISGTVTNGEGLLVLLSGPIGQAQATVTAGHYRFGGLPAGTYRAAVLGKEGDSGELAAHEGIAVDGANQLTVDFPEVPMPARAESRVTGKVRGGAGCTIVLVGPLADDNAGLAETRTTTVAQDETYSFTGLPAGTYRATLRDTDPSTGSTQTQAGIVLDGTPGRGARVDFDLSALGPGKTTEHYLLVGSVARSKEDFLAALRYVACFGPAVGSDETEARQARHVTILGSTSTVSALTEQGLRMSGCQVQRIETDLAAALGKLIDEGRAY
jgi:hypothetical protein